MNARLVGVRGEKPVDYPYRDPQLDGELPVRQPRVPKFTGTVDVDVDGPPA